MHEGGEDFGLDGKEYELPDSSVLVIADEKNPLR